MWKLGLIGSIGTYVIINSTRLRTSWFKLWHGLLRVAERFCPSMESHILEDECDTYVCRTFPTCLDLPGCMNSDSLLYLVKILCEIDNAQYRMYML